MQSFLIQLGQDRAFTFCGPLSVAKTMATRRASDDPNQGIISVADADGRAICRRTRRNCPSGSWSYGPWKSCR